MKTSLPLLAAGAALFYSPDLEQYKSWTAPKAKEL